MPRDYDDDFDDDAYFPDHIGDLPEDPYDPDEDDEDDEWDDEHPRQMDDDDDIDELFDDDGSLSDRAYLVLAEMDRNGLFC
jgi:hypothetical protein